MAILSNINGKFAVDSTGAIELSGDAGAANEVLVSGGAGAASTWVAVSTVIGGPYVQISGDTMTGNLVIDGSNSLTVGGVITSTDLITGTHFSGSGSGASIFGGSVITKPGSNNLGFIVRNDSNAIIGSLLRTTNTTSTLTASTLVLPGTTAQYVRGDGSLATYSPGTGTVTGSGTTNTVTKFTAASVIGDGPITFATNDSTFAGGIEVNQYIRNTTSNTNSNYIQRDSANTALYVQQRGAGNIVQFQYGAGAIGSATDALTISGTGTSTFSGDITVSKAAAAITINSTSGSQGTLHIGRSADTKAKITSGDTAASDLCLYTGGSRRLVILSSGNVGIGTASPGSALDIANTSGNTKLTIQAGTASSVTGGSSIDIISRNSGSGTSPISRIEGIFEDSNDSALALSTTLGGSLTERMRIDSSGQVIFKGTGNGIDLRFKDISAAISSETAGYIGMSTSAYSGQNGDLVLIPRTSAASNILLMQGNVGIGNTAPPWPLTVGGNVGFKTTTADGSENRFYFQVGGAADPGIFYIYNGAETVTTQIHSAGDSYFNGGNVGIGTTSPGVKLAVTSTETNWTSILKNYAAGAYGLSIDCSGASSANYVLAAYSPNGTGMFFNGSGNLGIGTASPASTLHIVGSGGYLQLTSTTSVGSIKSDYNLQLFADPENDNSSGYQNIQFFTAGSNERMRIGYNGNIGIGTTSPSVKFQVQQDQAAESNVMFMNNSTSAGAAMRLTLNVGNPAGNDPMISFNIGDGGFDWTMGVDNSDSDKFKISGGTDSHNPNLGTNDRLTIDSSGTLTMSGDVVAYSDKRLKENIKTLDGSKVYEMRGVSFNKDNKQGSGVIAQELEKIAPELINNDSKYKAVAYGNLTGYLIEAIKELEARVKELENK